jgi:hypothetical protein
MESMRMKTIRQVPSSSLIAPPFHLLLLLFLLFFLILGGVQCLDDQVPQIYSGSEHDWIPINDSFQFEAPRRQPQASDANTTILVSLASFRDSERCGRTVFALFKNATYPDRVTVAVVDQRDFLDADDTDDCVRWYCTFMMRHLAAEMVLNNGDGAKKVPKRCPYVHQIRMISMDQRDAAGPVYARAITHQLRTDNDEFCLQMDAHSDVTRRWDEMLLEEFFACDNEFAVISTYVPGMPIGDIGYVPVMCHLSLGVGDVFRNAAAGNARHLRRPLLQAFWAAGLSFSKCHLDELVPNDINVKYAFDGEEFTRVVRLWTWGYDVYAPTRNIVFHNYTSSRKKFDWLMSLSAEQAHQRDRSIERLRALQKGDGAQLGQRYGYGPCRTFEQYLQFAGIDLEHLKGPRTCGAQRRVPYDGTICHRGTSVERFHLTTPSMAEETTLEQKLTAAAATPEQTFITSATISTSTVWTMSLLAVLILALALVLILLTRGRRQSRLYQNRSKFV